MVQHIVYAINSTDPDHVFDNKMTDVLELLHDTHRRMEQWNKMINTLRTGTMGDAATIAMIEMFDQAYAAILPSDSRHDRDAECLKEAVNHCNRALIRHMLRS